MPLHVDIVGATTSAKTQCADARWLMAYAAALGDFNPSYLDTENCTVQAHPMFPVCLEWPVVLDTGHIPGFASLTPEENLRAVHAAHDIHIYRPIKADDTLVTQATIVGVRAVKPGAAMTTRLDTTDAKTGDLVVRTYQIGLFRGVALEGGDKVCEEIPPTPDLAALDGADSHEISAPEGAAHVYTECARIWNPIHTDRKVALASGLPDIILHGTATMAMTVSRIVDAYAGGDPSRIKRLGGRFSSMVLMPSTLRLECKQTDELISYQVTTESGSAAISDGYVVTE